jgi:16S rRNA (cytidine1402-2'-O)-methyltransferase
MPAGKIFIIPTPISDTDPKSVLPERVIRTIHELDTFFVENIRSARRFLSSAGVRNIQDIHFEILDKNTEPKFLEHLTLIVKNGKDVGIMSEAGCPGIADPGSGITSLAHKHGIKVIPLTGPSSIFLALMASGFNGQNFQFHGYLPINSEARRKSILNLERMVYSNNQTQIFMETPYRNNKILDTLLRVLRPDTLLCIAANITSENEFIKTNEVNEWKKQVPDLHKKPTIFLIYK